MHGFAASSRPAPSDAASACLLHVGEDVTRARPDTPTPCSDPRGSVHRFAASSRPAPSDAASSCLLHVGEDVTRARPDTPTPCSDPRGSVHRFAASSRPAPSDAASACLLHVGEDMTRARPDTPTPCSDPGGSVHRFAASSRPAPSDAANSCLVLRAIRWVVDSARLFFFARGGGGLSRGATSGLFNPFRRGALCALAPLFLFAWVLTAPEMAQSAVGSGCTGLDPTVTEDVMSRRGGATVNPFASGALSGETIGSQTDVPYVVPGKPDPKYHFELRPGSFTPQIDNTDPYGKFEVKADGSWTFTLKNNSRFVQGLSDDDTRCRAFVVQPANGGATVTVKIIVQGANDPPTSLTLTWVAPVTRVSDEVGSIPVKTSTASNVKVANLEVETKDNKFPTLGVTGADARRFVVVGSSLFWRAGKSLSTKPEYKFILLATSGIVEILSSEKTLRVGPSAPSAPAEPTVTPGNEQLRVRWTAPSTNGADITDYDVEYRPGTSGEWIPHNPSSTSDTSLSATITGLSNGQSYQVHVRASNSVGRSGWSTEATGTPGRAVPDAPGALELIPGNTQLEVSWSAPSGNGIAISGYNVKYQGSSGGWNNHASPGADDTSTTITGLDNNQLYRVQVRARNSVGPGNWASAPGTPVAQGPDRPAKPTLTPGNAQLVVEWTEPSTNGDDIIDYDVEYRLVTSDKWIPHNPLSISDTSISVTITGLTNGQSYQVHVLAASLAGHSDWSPIATGTLEARGPDVPAKPTLKPGNAKLVVEWTEPAENGASITDYDVQWQGAGGWINHELSTISISLFTTITGLTNGQSYDVRVRAKNSLGTSNWSTAARGTPALQPPDRPAKPTLKPGNRHLEVSWSKPADNDASISSYKVQYRLVTSDNWLAYLPSGALTTTDTIIPLLSNGQYYHVQVRAISSVGDSDWSESTTGAPGVAPDRPVKPTVKPGNRKLVVEWTAPAEHHYPISIYKVRYRPGTSGNWIPHNPSGALISPATIILPLDNGQSYQVQVRARSLAGDSIWSKSARGIPAAQLPDVPAKPTLTPGDRKLEVEWIAPSNNGARITDYDVRYKPISSDPWNYHSPLSVSTDTSITITSLINGLGYAVEVRASNSVDTSDWSTAATGTPGIPAAQPPDVPAEPTLILGNGQLGVRWIAPSSNGARITKYDVQYRRGNSGGFTKKDHKDASLSTTIDSLANNQLYQVQVRARNSAGNSDWSDSAEGTPKSEVPDAPGALKLISGNGELEVSWNVPSGNGARITGYDVQYKQGSGGWSNHDHADATLSTTITGLTNGQSYDVRVRATNSVGNSSWASAEGIPKPEVPDAPNAPELTPGNAQLVVKWTKPAENGADIIEYKVRYRRGSTNWTEKKHTDPPLSTTIDSLDNGHLYQVQVLARNSAGNSDWSTAAEGTPVAQKPDAPKRAGTDSGQRPTEGDVGACRPPTAAPSPATTWATAGARSAFLPRKTIGTPPSPPPSTASTTTSSTRCGCGRPARPATATGRTAPRVPRIPNGLTPPAR